MNVSRALFVVLLTVMVCTTTVSAQVALTEIHYHPVEEPAFKADGSPALDLTNDVHEFVEIQNTSSGTVDLSGWKISGGISFTFPSNTTIDSGGFKVIAKNPPRLALVYPLIGSEVLGPYAGTLNNGGDTVRLKNTTGDTIDSVTYDSRFPWAQSADALGAQDRFTGLDSANYQYKGRSLQRVSTTWPSSDPANWLASPLTGPTPGAAQSITRTIPKPVIIAQGAVQASYGATIIRSNQAVLVTCTYSATNNLNNVTLEYFLDNINSTTETRFTQSMTNLGNGKYIAFIPGQINRTIVRYRFRADRGDGMEVVSPRSDDPQLAPIGSNGALEAWWGYFVTPIRTTTNAAIYDVFISTTGLSRMSSNVVQNPKRVTAASATGLPRDVPYVSASAPQWNGTVYGLFAAEGKLFDIQIRYHGSIFHRAPANHSYKLHFPDHQPFNEQSSWFETLHGTEFIEAQKINRLLGLPASKMRRVDWYLNSGSNEIHSEQGEYASEMLDAYHELQQQLNPGSTKEKTGELYKNVGNRNASQNNLEGPYTRGDIAPISANAGWTQLQRYDWTFTLQNNSWKGAKPIRDLLEGMWTARGDTPTSPNFANDTTKLATTRTWFSNNWDIDTTITSMAMLEWMSIWDDAAQNHFFWRRANDQWVRLGWDYDGVMIGGGAGGAGNTNQTIYGGEAGATTVFDGTNWWKDTFYKCFRTAYQQRLWELNNSFFDPTNLTALGLTRASTFAINRRNYVNTQLSFLGTYYKPNRPANSYPANGGSVVSATNLVTTAYSHPQSTPHSATKWEIRTAIGDYEAPILRVTTTNANLTTYPIPFDQLTYGQTYYWRATHLDANNHPSIVSAETSFTWGTANTAAGALVINELLAFNRNTIQNGTEYPDYIELRNNTGNDIDLTGYTLTDNTLDPTKYSFPAGTIIAAGGYLLIWCDKDTSTPGLHSGFGLDSDGQTVLLMNGATIVDSVSFGPQAPDVAIGRIANGTGGWQANQPTPGTANSARTLGSVNSLRLNEWMANPAYGEDWFEIYNADTNAVALAGLYLSDTPATPTITQIPPLSFIEGKGFQRFWADGSSSGNAHANFRLNNSGENLALTAANGATPIDTLSFSTQAKDIAQGRLPNGGNTIVNFTNTASPGAPNWSPAPVYLNEILAHGHPPLEDAVEIYNPTASSVDIGGWWLSDDRLNPMKYQIPAGTSIPAGGYALLYEGSFNAGSVPFAFSAWGDEAMLSAVDGFGALTGYGSLAKFGPSPRHQSFGRIAATGLSATSGGAEYWAQTAHTFGQDNPPDIGTFRTGTGMTNREPLIGPVIINEIMYHPPDLPGGIDDTLNEYVELFNPAGTNVNLSDWRLRGDSHFSFPTNTSLTSGGYLLLVSFDPATNTAALAAFRATNNIPTNTPILGPYSDKLANSTASLELARPDVLDDQPVYYLTDKVEYRDLAPWTVAADGGGKSLQRTSLTLIGNTAANWSGETPTPGRINVGATTNVTITTATTLVGGVVGTAYTNTLTASGGTAPYTWVIATGSVSGLALSVDGVLTGTPTTAASNLITIQATDNLGATTSKAFGLTVAATALNISAASPLTNATLNAPYFQTLKASGGTAPYIWNYISGSFPAGLILSSAGVISGTPTNHGDFNFTVQVADSGGLTTTKEFALTVPVPPLTITTLSPMVGGQQDVAYSQAFTGAGGIPPYLWSLASGTLPPGLFLSSVGDLTGTPTTPGTFNFTARVTDNRGTNNTKSFTLTVVPPALTITTPTLPEGTISEPYYNSFTAAGGISPYLWNIVSGALPAGLSVDNSGQISGVPTNTGTFSFTVQVADAASGLAQRLFTVDINHHSPTLKAMYISGDNVSLLLSGDSGLNYTIESSTNLLDWQTAFTTNNASPPFIWSESVTGNSASFYRANMNP